MIKIYTLKQLVEYPSEQLILFGLLQNESSLNIGNSDKNFNGESRFHNVIDTCKTLFTYVDDINDCDIIVLPYKFKDCSDTVFQFLLNYAVQLNKTLYAFYIDDNQQQLIDDHPNVKLFRTSFFRSTKQSNEYAMPTVTADFFDGYLEEPELSIGYCGHKLYGREKYINMFIESDLKTDFIVRDGHFWSLQTDKGITKKDFIENMKNNLFIFCNRGAGNYSYRFYEIMMMGRIPILITTDSVFPHEDKYDLNDVGIVIEEKVRENKSNNYLIERIQAYYDKNNTDLVKIQKQNREIWEKYLSPCGFIKTIHSDLIK